MKIPIGVLVYMVFHPNFSSNSSPKKHVCDGVKISSTRIDSALCLSACN